MIQNLAKQTPPCRKPVPTHVFVSLSLASRVRGLLVMYLWYHRIMLLSTPLDLSLSFMWLVLNCVEGCC